MLSENLPLFYKYSFKDESDNTNLEDETKTVEESKVTNSKFEVKPYEFYRNISTILSNNLKRI